MWHNALSTWFVGHECMYLLYLESHNTSSKMNLQIFRNGRHGYKNGCIKWILMASKRHPFNLIQSCYLSLKEVFYYYAFYSLFLFTDISQAGQDDRLRKSNTLLGTSNSLTVMDGSNSSKISVSFVCVCVCVRVCLSIVCKTCCIWVSFITYFVTVWYEALWSIGLQYVRKRFCVRWVVFLLAHLLIFNFLVTLNEGVESDIPPHYTADALKILLQWSTLWRKRVSFKRKM